MEIFKVDCLNLQTDSTASEIKDQVLYTIDKYEPRAEVLDLIVTLDPDYHSLHVNVEFKVINTGVIVEFSTTNRKGKITWEQQQLNQPH